MPNLKTRMFNQMFNNHLQEDQTRILSRKFNSSEKTTQTHNRESNKCQQGELQKKQIEDLPDEKEILKNAQAQAPKNDQELRNDQAKIKKQISLPEITKL